MQHNLESHHAFKKIEFFPADTQVNLQRGTSEMKSDAARLTQN